MWLSINLPLILGAGLYSASVMAADQVLTAFDIPLVQFGYVLLMAFWGALASILQRFSKEEIPQNRLLVVAASDLVNASLAALIVFLFCEMMGIRPVLEAIYCSLAGFGGSRFMTAIYLRFEKRAQNTIAPEGVDSEQP